MQSANNIANICDCRRSFLFIFALIFAVFFALCKKYRNFFCSFLCSVKYITYICGIFYAAQITAQKYTLFSRKYLRNYMSWQTKCKFLRNPLCITENFAKNTKIFCGNVHCAKNTADLPHKYCSLLKILLHSAPPLAQTPYMCFKVVESKRLNLP